MDFSLLVVSVCISFSVVGTVVMTLACWLFGAPILEAQLFMGPSLTLFRISGVPFRLGLIPWGGSVRFVSATELRDASRRGDLGDVKQINEGETLGPLLSKASYMEQIHPLKRIPIYGAGIATIFGMCTVVLGVDRAFASLRGGFGQLIRGSVDERVSLALFEKGNLMLASEPLSDVVALVATKLVAFHLFPVVPLYGAVVILFLASAVVRRELEVHDRIVQVSFLLVLFFLMRWGGTLVESASI